MSISLFRRRTHKTTDETELDEKKLMEENITDGKEIRYIFRSLANKTNDLHGIEEEKNYLSVVFSLCFTVIALSNLM